MQNSQLNHFNLIVQKSLEGSLSPEEIQFLRESLLSSVQARRYYIDCMTVHGSLFLISDRILSETNGQGMNSINKVLINISEYEKSVPANKIPLEEPQAERFRQIDRPVAGDKQKISKWNIISLTAAAAAIILIFVFTYFVLPVTGFKVAVLSDCMDAKWAGMKSVKEKDSPFYTSQKKLLLKEGYARLLFDNQTQVTLEGPAEFQILSDDKVNLRYGKLYVKVPTEAIGFTIMTQNTKVIDLGTEFGVDVSDNGDTCLHVIKGKTVLIAGEESQKVSMEVTQGNAKKVMAVTSKVSDIPCDSGLFVRTLDSGTRMLWKGQSELSLADITGGGNGLGTGTNDHGIDPTTGLSASTMLRLRSASNEYHASMSNPYIDGVFVPNGQTKQIISSQGHLFRECPVSGGLCFNNIVNAAKDLDSQSVGQAPGLSRTQCLLIHANAGITYNLQAIRDHLPGVKIVRFQSKFGIEKGAIRPAAIDADFWILVDGNLKYQKTQVKERNLFDVSIELSERDHFLTLVTTDGQAPKGRVMNNLVLSTIDSDWCMFVDPVLVLK
jgi:hypothetical protein